MPDAIQSYFKANYSTDTLLKASKNCDISYMVLSKNNGLFATVFDANGAFLKRITLPLAEGGFHNKTQSIDQSALPASINIYLSSMYPSYVFEKAFAIKQSSTITGYVVVLDANNTKYTMAFDASGKFVKAKTLY